MALIAYSFPCQWLFKGLHRKTCTIIWQSSDTNVAHIGLTGQFDRRPLGTYLETCTRLAFDSLLADSWPTVSQLVFWRALLHNYQRLSLLNNLEIFFSMSENCLLKKDTTSCTRVSEAVWTSHFKIIFPIYFPNTCRAIHYWVAFPTTLHTNDLVTMYSQSNLWNINSSYQ